MECPECGNKMFKNNNVWECSNCGCTYVKNEDDNLFTKINTDNISNKVNEIRESERVGKIISGLGTVAEQVSIQAKKEHAYIKSRNGEQSTALVDDNEFFISKHVLDGVDFVSNKKQEMDDAKKARDEEIKRKNEIKEAEKEEEKIKRGEEKVKEEAKNRPKDALFYIDGREGTLAIFDEFIQLDFTGSAVKKYLSRLGGIKRIYYPQINSIQKRDVSDVILGSIEFELPGMTYSGRGGGKKENVIHYDYYYQEEADKIYEFVNQKILNIQKNKINPQPNIPNEMDVLSEIKKAKELLDMGAITQEEFDKIKKELLG